MLEFETINYVSLMVSYSNVKKYGNIKVKIGDFLTSQIDEA